MKEKAESQLKSDALRKNAKEKLRKQTKSKPGHMPEEELERMSAEDIKHLVMDLRVHQIELEMQNEELRRSQEGLEKSREKYADLYDFAPIGYFTLDQNGLIIEANLTGTEMLGCERSLLIKKPFSNLVTGDDRDRFYLYRRQVIQTLIPPKCEIRLIKKDGNEFYAQLESIAVKDSSGNFKQIRVAVTDIARRKEAEEELQKAKDMLENMVKDRTAELNATIELLQKEIKNRKKAEKAMRESKEKLQILFESINDAIFLIDEKGYFIDTNSLAYRRLGYTREEMLSMHISQLDPPEFADKIPERMKQIKKHGKAVFESAHVRKDGTRMPVEVNSRTINFGGKKIFLSSIRDITERKKDEEQIKKSLKEKEVLLKEVHHRVKNNMAVISSLLKLQADRVRDEHSREMLNDSMGRIKTMALIHEKLYRSEDLSRINFSEYIKDMVDNIYMSHDTDSHKVILKKDIENVALGLDIAIPCGLVVNELVSNSLKHAFPQNVNGEIKVAVRTNDKDEIELSISDNGTGMPEDLDFKNPGSLGLHLVNALTRQLQGTIELHGGKGTEFKITFKRRDRY